MPDVFKKPVATCRVSSVELLSTMINSQPSPGRAEASMLASVRRRLAERLYVQMMTLMTICPQTLPGGPNGIRV